MRAINIDGNKVLNVIVVNDLSFPVLQGTLIEDISGHDIGYAQPGGLYIDRKFYPPKPSNEEQSESRRKTYEAESDPLFFMVQRGEATQEEYELKLIEIKKRIPYYFTSEGAPLYDIYGNLPEDV
jgi:hypothetical protein